MTEKIIKASTVAEDNDARIKALREDYQALGARLARRGVDIDGIKVKVSTYGVAVPSWGVGTGGTRFARHAMRGFGAVFGVDGGKRNDE